MQYKTLGKIGIKISPVGLGCMGLSHAFGTLLERWRPPTRCGPACDLGYTLFDTAECYTETTPTVLPPILTPQEVEKIDKALDQMHLGSIASRRIR